MRDRFNERYIAAIKADCMHECCLESGFVKLSKADTFIEYCFEMACAHMNRGLDVLTEWRYRKDQYCKITDTIIYDLHTTVNMTPAIRSVFLKRSNWSSEMNAL